MERGSLHLTNKIGTFVGKWKPIKVTLTFWQIKAYKSRCFTFCPLTKSGQSDDTIPTNEKLLNHFAPHCPLSQYSASTASNVIWRGRLRQRPPRPAWLGPTLLSQRWKQKFTNRWCYDDTERLSIANNIMQLGRRRKILWRWCFLEENEENGGGACSIKELLSWILKVLYEQDRVF